MAEAELEMGSKLRALSELVDHTAKAGSQAMSHMAHLEAQTKADIQGQLPGLSVDTQSSCKRTSAPAPFPVCWLVAAIKGSFWPTHEHWGRNWPEALNHNLDEHTCRAVAQQSDSSRQSSKSAQGEDLYLQHM